MPGLAARQCLLPGADRIGVPTDSGRLRQSGRRSEAMRATRRHLALVLVWLLGGCAVGYNSTLFVTKSNIGIDADTKPPTLELSIARREGVLAPGFEGGQTPPVMASFRTNSNPFSRFFFGVQSTFAGGDASVLLARGPGGATTDYNSALCLSKPPEARQFLGIDVSIPPPGRVEPFFFATDTTFGLKVAWSGTTGQFPDRILLGFNRKEFAWAPVFGTPANCDIAMPTRSADDPSSQGTYAVSMPPFLAILDNDVTTGSPSDTGVGWLQYFATGTPATTLAMDDTVRRVLMQRMVPGLTSGKWSNDAGVTCLDNWLGQQEARAADLTKWWSEQGLTGIAPLLIKTDAYKTQRENYMKARNIACNP